MYDRTRWAAVGQGMTPCTTGACALATDSFSAQESILSIVSDVGGTWGGAGATPSFSPCGARAMGGRGGEVRRHQWRENDAHSASCYLLAESCSGPRLG